MDPKESGQTVACPESSGTEAPTAVAAIPAKSLGSVTSGFQKCSQSPGPEAAKILSRNCNGTVVLTSSPNNEAELQLYRVMQKASLLAYYDTLLEMGGDDLQQLCDAGEEEFLEIMALVGMASKPLHVRRLQKALQEWITSPALFQTPLTADVLSANPVVPHISNTRPVNAPPALTAAIPALSFPRNHSSPGCKEASPSLLADQNQVTHSESHSQKDSATPRLSPNPMGSIQGPGSPSMHSPVLVESQILRLAELAEALVKTLPQFEPKPHNAKKKLCRDLENVMNMAIDDPRRMDEIRKYSAIYGRFDCKRNPQKPLTLHEVSVNEAAAQICRFAPALLTRRDDLFALARKVVRHSGYHYTKGHPSISATTKPNLQTHQPETNNPEETHNSKRPKTDAAPSLSPLCGSGDLQRLKRQARLEQISEELRLLGDKTDELVQAAQQVRQSNDVAAIQNLQHQMETVQNKQTQLLLEQSDLLRQPLPPRIYRRSNSRLLSSQFDSDKHDTDDTDSQFSSSNASSPSQEAGDPKDSLLRDSETFANNNGPPSTKAPANLNKQYIVDILSEDGFRSRKSEFFFQDNKVQVISASGGNIIAVANPALSMSSVLSLKAKDINSSSPDTRLSVKIENEN